MQVTLDGETTELIIPRDLESDRPYAEQKLIMDSYLTINSVGRKLAETGMLVRPMVQVTLQRQDGEMRLLSAELFDDQGFDAPLAMGMDGGEGELVSFSLEEGHLEARVEGEFLRLESYMKEPKVAEWAKPVPVTIDWTAEIAPLD